MLGAPLPVAMPLEDLMPHALLDAPHRLWSLHGRATTYAVRLAEDDSVRHVHRHAALTLPQAVEPAERTSPAASSFEAPADVDELAVGGGARSGRAETKIDRNQYLTKLNIGLRFGLCITRRTRSRPR
jgi:hypothetical protein